MFNILPSWGQNDDEDDDDDEMEIVIRKFVCLSRGWFVRSLVAVPDFGISFTYSKDNKLQHLSSFSSPSWVLLLLLLSPVHLLMMLHCKPKISTLEQILPFILPLFRLSQTFACFGDIGEKLSR